MEAKDELDILLEEAGIKPDRRQTYKETLCNQEIESRKDFLILTEEKLKEFNITQGQDAAKIAAAAQRLGGILFYSILYSSYFSESHLNANRFGRIMNQFLN